MLILAGSSYAYNQALIYGGGGIIYCVFVAIALYLKSLWLLIYNISSKHNHDNYLIWSEHAEIGVTEYFQIFFPWLCYTKSRISKHSEWMILLPELVYTYMCLN